MCNLAAEGSFTGRETWCICSSLVAPPSFFLAGSCGGGSTNALCGRSFGSLAIGDGGWIWTEGFSVSGCQMLPSIIREIGREVAPVLLLPGPMMEMGCERGSVFAKISSTEKLLREGQYIIK